MSLPNPHRTPETPAHLPDWTKPLSLRFQPPAPAPNDPFPDAWTPPQASVASRNLPRNFKGSFHAFIPDPVINRVVTGESGLEGGFYLLLRTDPRVAWIWDQPPPVEYVDEDGVVHEHTFDYLAVLHDGRRIAFAVKPAIKVASTGIERVLELIRAQLDPAFATSVVLRTEAHITADRVHNARMILDAFQRRDEAHLARVLALLDDVTGAVRIADLVEASGLEGHALPAIAGLIGDGLLTLSRHGRITMGASVIPVRAH